MNDVNTTGWLNTLPKTKETNNEKYKLDPNRWLNTLPKTESSNSMRKYFLTTIIFICGLIFVSVIKNETRSLQKEIYGLQTSINKLEFDLHQATLDYEVITSPENISKLADEHLELDLIAYKRIQIKNLSFIEKNDLTFLDDTVSEKKLTKKNIKLSSNIKNHISKKIETKKAELEKLQNLYNKPEKIPGEIKLQVSKKIERKKNQIKNIYNNPEEIISPGRNQKSAGIQLVKAFLGIPMIPGE